MACSSCGDNVAPKCNKDFTETVVKINNPSKIILFRKVVVPSSMGDEEDFPPTVGKYRNVLLQYEASGSIYLYSSDGIPTQISTDVSELIRRINELGVEIRVEKEERIAGDEALSEEIESLSSSLSDEAEARAQADATLQDNIDAEAQAREDADASLSADIVAEAQTRANADTALGGRIDDVEDDLDAEITNRTNADNQLRNSINNEISARETADETLQNNINTVSSNLAAETSARQSADNALQTNINTEASTRALADTELNRAISAEVTARQTADNSLQTQIDSIVASSDVRDIVGTHAELEDYDTSILGNNDIIKVLQDETQDDATTYYRWSTQTQSFSLIGTEGPYYTKSQADTLLNAKQNTLTAGSNIQIVGDTISATDTKYTAGNGLNLSGTQFSVDTSTIATKSDIPTVNNATLTIQKNGTTVQTFTANSGTNKTANITVPTNNNELTNGAGYQTAADVQTAIADKQDRLTAGNAIDITNNIISADIYPADYFTGDATSCDEGTTVEAENPIGIASFELKGNTYQDGTPTPDAPIPVQTATGRQVVTISNGSQSQEYEVNLGKNLFDANSELPPTWNNGDVIFLTYNVEPNTTYTMSSNIPLASGYANIFLYDSSGSGSTGTNGVAVNKPVTVTSLSDGIIKVGYRSRDNATINRDDYWYQLEKGSTATSYAPYFEPIELCKIGNYQDYIYKSGSDWYVHKATNKLVFDGSDDEQWGYASSNGRFYCNANLYIGGVLPPNDNGTVDMFCNSLVARSYQTAWTNVTNYSVTARYDNNSNPRIINTDYTSLADFKTWISNNPVTLYYPLATSTDIQITNTALVAQLNALAAATTYGEETTFTVSGPNQLVALDICTLNRTLEGTLAKIDNKQNRLTAGNAIDIDNDIISAAVYPEDYFTNENATVSGTGTDIELEGTTELSLKNVDLLGDTYQQTYSGKNLFNVTGASSGGITGSTPENPAILTVTGTATTTDGVPIAVNNSLSGISAGTWIMSIDHASTHVINVVASVPGETVASFRFSPGETTKTATLSTTPTKLEVFWATTSGTTYNETFKFQLESGSSATSFEPYTGGIPSPNPDYPQEIQAATGRQVVTVSNGTENQEYEINLGKNLFDKDTANTLVGAYPGANTIIGVSGSTATTICYIQCEPNATYTVQKENSGANNRFVVFTTATTPALNTSVLNYIGTIGAEDNNAEYTITTPANAHFLGIFFAAPGGATTPSAAEIMATIQIEKGSTATTYAPYFTPIELCKIGDYQDRIYRDGDDWYLRKEIGKIDLSSIEWYEAYTNLRGTRQIPNVKYVSSNLELGVGLAEKYRMHTGSGMGSSEQLNNIAIDVNQVTVHTGSDQINPTGLFYYALAVPTDTRITNEALIDQLDALAGATTYKDGTTITVSSDNTKVILSTSAFTRSYSGTIEAINSRGSGNANVNIGYGLEKSGSIISVDTDEIAAQDDLDDYLPLAGGTMTGKIVAKDIETGTENYVLARHLRGQGTAATYYHAIDFGHSGNNDTSSWYEYGGRWNFWKNNQSAEATTNTDNLALGITTDALKNKSYTYSFPNKTGTFALTSDLPTVNNATLTIQNDGNSVNTFTANASSNVTANVVPWSLEMKDYRSSLIPTNRNNLRMTAFFTSEGGLDSQTGDYRYCDAIMLSGWNHASGGRVNLLAATKTDTQAIYHYTAPYDSSTWTSKKQLAYVEDIDADYLKKSGGAITGAITRNLGSGAIANTNIFTLTGSTDGFAVDYDSSTSDLGITKIYSTDDANAQLSLGNKVGSNYKEAINITNGVATVNGNSSTATKLATARTIALGTGATGTATSFDGSANITIPVTDVKESYVTWGGKNHIDGDMTPGVMGCVDEFSHNKFAFLPAQLIAVAYSQDGGSTWTDYPSITNDMKVQLVTYDANVTLYTGGRATATNTASDDRLRVRIHNLDGTANLIYTSLKEILINISGDGASGMKVQIRNRTIGDYQNNVENWTTVGTYDLLGWSGWNSIPYIYRFGGSTGQTGNVGEMELIFWATGRASTNKNMELKMLRFIGSDTWSAQSEMAKTGRLYTIDASQNATFPANVKVTGSLQHSSYTYQLPSANGTLATITMTTTDPGEGAAIADGQFIAVYSA